MKEVLPFPFVEERISKCRFNVLKYRRLFIAVAICVWTLRFHKHCLVNRTLIMFSIHTPGRWLWCTDCSAADITSILQTWWHIQMHCDKPLTLFVDCSYFAQSLQLLHQHKERVKVCVRCGKVTISMYPAIQGTILQILPTLLILQGQGVLFARFLNLS